MAAAAHKRVAQLGILIRSSRSKGDLSLDSSLRLPLNFGETKSNFRSMSQNAKNSQEHHFSLSQRENEKLRSSIEKILSELRYEMRFMLRDNLSNQIAEISSLTNKFDQKIHLVRARLEATKYDMLKYCIGTLISISVVGFIVIRKGPK